MIQNCNKDKILELFLEDPLKGFKLREISRIINLGLPSVSKYIKELSNEKFIEKKEIQGIPLFFANRENRMFKLQKIFHNLQKIEDSQLINAIEEELTLPTIILFGSLAKGEDRKESDIDLCIISQNKGKLKLERFEEKLKKEIQLFIFSEKEFLELKKENKELFNNIINGFVLRGLLRV